MKELKDLSWEELLEATSTETLRDERCRDNASFAGTQRIQMDGALEETIHKEIHCEHCGERNIPTNVSQYHKNGKCVERKKMIESMKKDYESGIPLLQVAKKYDYSYSGIERIFVENGIELRKRTKVTKEMRQQMLDLLADGVSKTKVAEIYNISFRKLQKVLSEE